MKNNDQDDHVLKQKKDVAPTQLLLAIKKILDKDSYVTTALFIIILLYTLYFASSIILPIVLAFLLNSLFAPIIRYLRKMYIPTHLSAICIILLILTGLGSIFYGLATPTTDWLKKGPAIFSQINAKLSTLTKPLEKPLQAITKITDSINNLTHLPTSTNTQVVSLPAHNVLGSIFNTTGDFFSQFTIMIVLLYFLLTYEDFLLIKLVKILPHLKDKKDVVNITRETETKIGIYLGTRVALNAALAVVISILMYFLNMPNPILWGIMAGLLEFIPYIGVLIGTVIIALVAILTFDTMTQIILIPTVFFTVCSIQGHFITTLVLGRSFTMNPIVVFLAVIFWGWIWGIIGAIIAIPLIVIIKIIYENLYTDTVVGEFLNE